MAAVASGGVVYEEGKVVRSGGMPGTGDGLGLVGRGDGWGGGVDESTWGIARKGGWEAPSKRRGAGRAALASGGVSDKEG